MDLWDSGTSCCDVGRAQLCSENEMISEAHAYQDALPHLLWIRFSGRDTNHFFRVPDVRRMEPQRNLWRTDAAHAMR